MHERQHTIYSLGGKKRTGKGSIRMAKIALFIAGPLSCSAVGFLQHNTALLVVFKAFCCFYSRVFCGLDHLQGADHPHKPAFVGVPRHNPITALLHRKTTAHWQKVRTLPRVTKKSLNWFEIFGHRFDSRYNLFFFPSELTQNLHVIAN